MKLLSATSTLLLLKGAMSQDCPAELTQSTSLSIADGSTLTFKYAVVLSGFTDSQNLLCAQLERDAEGFIGFGISPTGEMSGGEAIIGIPDDADDNPGTVMKYNLSGDSPRTSLMSNDKQTLMHTNITQADGNTFMTFAKYLNEIEENEIFASGDNTFLYALGEQGKGLSFHGNNRGDFTLDFEVTRKPTSYSTTLEPTFGGVYVAPGLARTMMPTGQGRDRDEPSPTSPPAPTPDIRTPPVVPTPDTPTPDTRTPDAPTPDAPTPDAPTPDTPTPDTPTPDALSGATIRKKIGTMILGAGAVAVWFGM
mmetsp:Transcript_12831/g.23611  ORF Transcript_12831/g.23611 Transcript_12831/m.23611 type:complete len:309 (-) Transcript_12831:120-1046(-)